MILEKKIFLDAEFTGLHRGATLISLALVADSGEEFYAEFTDYDASQLTDWVRVNVLPHLFLTDANKRLTDWKRLHVKGSKHDVVASLRRWLAQFGEKDNRLQVWADCPSWDWMLFCDLFGGAFGIPPSIHYMPMDMATVFYLKTGNPDVNRRQFVANRIDTLKLTQHHALYDAYILKECFKVLLADERLSL